MVAAVFAAGFFGAAFFVAGFLVATSFAVAVAGVGLAVGAGLADRFRDCFTLLSDLRVERRWVRASILRVLEVGLPLAAATGVDAADARLAWNAATASLNA